MAEGMPPASATPNPYAPPTTDISGTVEPVFDITREEVGAYVGESQAFYYWTRWRASLQSRSLLAGFNWGACVFNVTWMVYRRMYREFFVAMAIAIVLGAGIDLLESVDQNLSRVFDRAWGFLFAGTVGTIGNGLYLRRARLVIAAARKLEPDEQRRIDLIRRQGGTSFLWMLIVTAVSLGMVVLGALQR